MSYHVDIISNEPLAGRQHLLARIHMDDHGQFRVESDDVEHMLGTLRQIVPELDPDHDPAAFVAALPERVDYTYMIASEPHSATDCGFDHIGASRPDAEHERHAAAW